MKPVWIAGFLAAVLALSAIPALAQPVISAKSGLISYVEGKVYLGDQIVEPSPTHFPDVKENALVRTAEGRAEVLLTPGVVLRLGENSSFKMLTNRLIDTRLELLTGSAVVEADEIAKDTSVTLVCKDGTVSLGKKGLYRLDTAPARLKVFEGLASVQVAGQNVEVASGKMLSLGGTIASVENSTRKIPIAWTTGVNGEASWWPWPTSPQPNRCTIRAVRVSRLSRRFRLRNRACRQTCARPPGAITRGMG